MEEAWKRDQSFDDEDSNQGFSKRSLRVDSDRWWPKKCFRPDEIRSPAMTKKNLRNIGYLSHSTLPRVNANLELIDSDNEVTTSKQKLPRSKHLSNLLNVSKYHSTKQLVMTTVGDNSTSKPEAISVSKLVKDSDDS